MESTFVSTRSGITVFSPDQMFRFLIEKLILARIDLHCETERFEYGEAENMYLAHLLESLGSRTTELYSKNYLSFCDCDVRAYIESHPGLRNEYNVYKDNADFGLISQGVFTDYRHKGSYYHQAFGFADAMPRVGLYYRLAASALEHLQGNTSLVPVLWDIADHVQQIKNILRKVASEYFDFIERISTGSLYHLGTEIKSLVDQKKYKDKLDEFLELYKIHKDLCDSGAGRDMMRERLSDLVKELKKLNPAFSCDDIF